MKANRLKMAAGAFALLLVGGNAFPAFSQQIDPALTGAVTAQTLELKSLHDKRRKTQEKIIAAEAAVTVALDRVHSVENKMLEYLSNAQGGGAESLPNQTSRGTGDDRDTAELQPAAQIGGKQPQGHGDSGHRVGRADGRGHADGGTLSVHETARDFGQLRCDRG